MARTQRTAIVLVLVAAGVLVATAIVSTGRAAADREGTVHRPAQTDQEVRDYWTTQRMDEAGSAMPTVEPGALPGGDPSGPARGVPGSVDGQPPR